MFTLPPNFLLLLLGIGLVLFLLMNDGGSFFSATGSEEEAQTGVSESPGPAPFSESITDSPPATYPTHEQAGRPKWAYLS